jgi:putative ABC transport system permease protein
MDEVVAEQTASRRVQVRVLGAFAAIAFLLAGIGIHGVLAYAVSSRRKEIAVRMALGAETRDIVRMVMRHGGRLALAGVVPGLILAYAAGKAMQALLAGLQPADPTTFGLAAALCVAMTLLGSLLPVLRAVRVVPMTAIRTE